jgi:geranylgeranyl pyrophosphate synthase
MDLSLRPEPPESLDGWMSARRAALDALFDARLSAPDGDDPGRLIEAIRYSALAPGKRIRPLLALAAAEAVAGAGMPEEDVLLASASVELVHCYSLIHDDLPAMDDDDFRRGRPSNHKVFGEAIAILAGDGLLTLAFEWIAEAGGRSPRPERFLRAVTSLARGAGISGMVRGQARDLREPPPGDLQALERLHLEKTAALFRAAVEIGGWAAGGGPDALAALGRFGTAFGVAFQHADDFGDADHTAHAGSARQRLDLLIGEAVGAVAQLGSAAGRLTELAYALGQRAKSP